MESLVLERILNVKNLIEQDGVGAEGDVSRSLAQAEALDGFEPLPVRVDHADGGIGDVENAPGDSRKAVVALLGFAIEDIQRVEGGDAGGFVGGSGRCLHGSAPGNGDNCARYRGG